MPADEAIGATDINEATRNVCLWLPDTEEVPSRGSPDFRVNGKTFATYTVNHHGDGRISLWLRSPHGAQEHYSQAEPEHYFVPPYVGPRGWLGVSLDSGLKWDTIATRVREAWEEVAPARLHGKPGTTPRFKAPDTTMKPEDFDPLNHPRAQTVLNDLRAFCLGLPEASEDTQFGDPVFRAGKKGFCTAHRRDGRMQLHFWVGDAMQSMLTYEDRYRIPAYTGRNGWIALDVEEHAEWDEIRGLIMLSYRHFALKRMLKALSDLPQPRP